MIIIGEKEKNLPKTWQECVAYLSIREGMEYVDENSMTHFTRKIYSMDKSNINYLPKGMGKAILSLSQLLICRNAWWEVLDWKPDWGTSDVKFCIASSSDGICRRGCTDVGRILAFPTREVRDKFLDSFGDLIKEAKELL